jgi:6-phosphogluconolactonase
VTGKINILSDPPALAHHVAEWMTASALAKPGPFRVSLSGGSTPKMLYTLLASDAFRDRFPWRRVTWYWGDERFVPYDHPDSNYRMTKEAMLAHVPVPPENIHPVPADGAPEDAALRYEQTLQAAYGATVLDPARPFFDITLDIPPHCYRANRCSRSASAGWSRYHTDGPRFELP